MPIVSYHHRILGKDREQNTVAVLNQPLHSATHLGAAVGSPTFQHKAEMLKDANCQGPQGSLEQSQATTGFPQVQRLPRYSCVLIFPSLQSPLNVQPLI